MTWNHRLICLSLGDCERVAIHEVYYKDGNPWMFAENPAKIYCFSTDFDSPEDFTENAALKSISWTLEKMQEALSQPILTAADFPKLDPTSVSAAEESELTEAIAAEEATAASNEEAK